MLLFVLHYPETFTVIYNMYKSLTSRGSSFIHYYCYYYCDPINKYYYYIYIYIYIYIVIIDE